MQFSLIALLAFVPIAKPFWQFSNSRNFAIAMYISAIFIFAFAVQALKPALRINPIPKAEAPLITNGIYKHLRHPMYFAVMMIATGLLIQKNHPISFAIWLSLGANMNIKARYEDLLLRQRHSNASDYQNKTSMLKVKKWPL